MDPMALAAFFERLKSQPGSELTGVASWLSSHPEHDARIGHVRELAPTLPAGPRRPLTVDWSAVQAAARAAANP
jgi:predicted Zn-dependent protease